MPVPFSMLAKGDKFTLNKETDELLPVVSQGRVWQKAGQSGMKGAPGHNCYTGDMFQPYKTIFIFQEAEVYPVGCPYCEQVERFLFYGRGTDLAGFDEEQHREIMEAAAHTFMTMMEMGACHHQKGTEFDYKEGQIAGEV